MRVLAAIKRLGPDALKRVAGRLSATLADWQGHANTAPVGILCYHRIAPVVRGVPPPTMNVTPGRFRAQLRGLLARGFCFRPLSDLLDVSTRGGQPPARTVAVTFDDAFESVYHAAWPTLCELKVPATVFQATAFLDAEDPFPFDSWGLAQAGRVPSSAYRSLTTQQCREMIASGIVEVGSHTHTHADFRNRPGEFAADLRRSLEEIRTRFGSDEVTFAFPFGRRYLGQVGSDLVSAARQVGVRCALTTEATPIRRGDDPFTWGRFNVYDWDTADTLVAKLEGWYDWAPRLQEWLVGAR